jgi:hypothetical protein
VCVCVCVCVFQQILRFLLTSFCVEKYFCYLIFLYFLYLLFNLFMSELYWITCLSCSYALYRPLILHNTLWNFSNKNYSYLHKDILNTCLIRCEISSSHGSEYDVQNCLLGCTSVYNNCRPTFQRCVLPPSSGQYAPLKRRSTVIVHGSTSQKTILNVLLESE